MKVLIKPNATAIQSYEAVAITEDIYRVNNKYYKKSSLIFLEDEENEIIFDMVFIKGGVFELMEEIPSQIVEVSDFWIGKHPVTQKQWKAIMGTNPSYFKNCDNCPVENVSWNDVQEFLKKLNAKTGKNYRLPNQKEWIYAAKGGENYKYAGSDTPNKVTWHRRNSDGSTQPVKQKLPNGYGLHDMSGNVWEWCEDWVNFYEEDGQKKFKAVRGGAYSHHFQGCRIYSRAGVKITEGNNETGFRLAL